MFEESLLESAHLLRTQSRWPAFASVALQAALAATIVTIPLLHPEILPIGTLASTLAPPAPVRPTPPPVQRTRVETSIAIPEVPTSSQPFRHIPIADPIGTSEAVPQVGTIISMTGPETALNPLLIATSNGARPHVVAATPSKPMAISQGVSAGLLLAPILPVYPILAKASRTEGTVVIHAIISKEGRIESASVVSGPQLLQGAALDAVRVAHYRPYLLNGEATEVETTFNINFRLNI